MAQKGFIVDGTFRDQTAANADRFSTFPATRKQLFLPGGEPPAVGTVFKNKDLAATYRLIAREGTKAFYDGEIAGDIVATVQSPPVDPASTVPCGPG